ncbi:MAG: aminotransferase class I/II-fold pyridoxal phosphate-dependent enzyme [Erysipelotrichaceae bacterium]|nr:aminotransferase class I/II-fold pyridoxal phosphate-dependent enzyme [Erysipelotrichaceae bacterium]
MIFDEEINQTIRYIKPSGIRKFFDIASTKKGVVSLGVGEPDFITPWHIREAAIHAIEKGRTFYTGNKGLLQLREGVCDYYKRRFSVDYDAEENVIITVGGSEAIDIILRTLIKPGDEVILPTPAYVAYAAIIEMAGGVVVEVPLEEKDEFKLTPEAFEKALSTKTKAVILNFPGNPTGGIMNYEDYEKIVPIIKENSIFAITDEIYAELTYEQKHCSIAQFEEIKDRVIVINGFSKAYSMTGYRVGYILAHKDIISMCNKIHQYTIMCATTPSQYAAIEAVNYGDHDIEEMFESFKQRRNYIVKELNRIGLRTHMPKGAFYVFPSIACTGLSSETFCETLLEEENLALVPGNAFGDAGEGYVRISYAYSLQEIKLAIEKLEHYLLKYRQGDLIE